MSASSVRSGISPSPASFTSQIPTTFEISSRAWSRSSSLRPRRAAMKKLRVMQFGRFDNQQFPGGLQIYVQNIMTAMKDSVQCDNFVASYDRKPWTRQEGDNRVIAATNYGMVASIP